MKEKKTFFILIAILILGISLWYGAIFIPTNSKIENINNDLIQVLDKVKSARKANLDIKNIESRFSLVQQKLENEKSRFIRKNELSKVTYEMSSLAQKYQIKLTDFSPELDNYFAENEKAKIVALSLVVSIKGQYINIGRFLENWHKLPFYITSDKIEIIKINDKNNDLEAKIYAKLYTWND